jgi:hypothetical protein
MVHVFLPDVQTGPLFPLKTFLPAQEAAAGMTEGE